jgi:hypothetical protein
MRVLIIAVGLLDRGHRYASGRARHPGGVPGAGLGGLPAQAARVTGRYGRAYPATRDLNHTFTT